ncbi:kinase-like domain-containing protein [Aspergillus heterothallicus]
MAAAMTLPDLVTDTRLLVEIHDGYTHYLTIERGSRRQWRKETWRRTQCLGEGATGEVWLEECNEDEQKRHLHAVKIMPKRGQTDYYRELETIAKFSQSTSKYEGLFVKSLGWYENERSVFIVMEHIEYGSLTSHLKQPLPEAEVKQITIQVLEGLDALHENGFAHRDLNPNNILVASKGPRWWVKIGDFGFSKRITEANSVYTTVGTQNYFAPEVLGLNNRMLNCQAVESRYTFAVDMWSLGVTVFYMLCHEYPFKDQELLAYTQGAPFPSAALTLHQTAPKARAFAEALLTVDAFARMSAKAALKDRWLTEVAEDFRATIRVPTSGMKSTSVHSYTTASSRSWPVGSTVETSMSKPTVSKSPKLPTLKASPVLKESRDKKHLAALRTLHKEGVHSLTRLKFARAATVLRRAVDGREVALGPHHKNTLDSKLHLGRAYNGQHLYTAAYEVITEATEGYIETLGPLHKDTLAARIVLVESLCGLKKYQEAQDSLESIMQTRRALSGKKKEENIQLFNLAAEIYCRQENYSDAASILMQLLDLVRNIEGSDGPSVPRILGDLGRCWYLQHMYEEAEETFREVVDNDTRNGRTGEQASDNALWLVDSLYKRGRTDQAQLLLLPVLSQLLLPVPKSPLRINVQLRALRLSHAVGMIQYTQKKYREAYVLFQKEAQGYRQIYGPTHEATLDAWYHLGRTHIERQLFTDAIEAFKDLERIHQLALGSRNRRTMKCGMWLGFSFLGSGQLSDGHDHLVSAAHNMTKTLGAEDEDTLECSRYLGISLSLLHLDDRAEPLLRDILTYQTKVFGLDYQRSFRTASDLGIVLLKRKKYQESESLFQQAAEGFERLLGIRDDETLDALSNLGWSMEQQKRWDEATQVYERVRDTRRVCDEHNYEETSGAIRRCRAKMSGSAQGVLVPSFFQLVAKA